jgi:hypothetical protein
MESCERIGVLLGNLLDLDAAFGRQYEQRLLRATIERDREVVLLRDVRGPLDPELVDDVPTDVESQDRARLLLRVGGIVRELDAAGLAATAGQDLRLDDDRAAELLSRCARLVRCRREASVRYGDAEAAKQLLALVLVKVQVREFTGSD